MSFLRSLQLVVSAIVNVKLDVVTIIYPILYRPFRSLLITSRLKLKTLKNARSEKKKPPLTRMNLAILSVSSII